MFAHMTLGSADVATLAAFYENVVGWTYIHHPLNVASECAWLEISEGQQLHILRVDGFKTSAFEREYGRHMAFFQGATKYAALRKRLADAEVEVFPPERETPFSRFFFRDLEGYMIEIIHREEYLASQE